MKCVRSIYNKEEVFRCSDEKAAELVKKGYHKYTAKKVWKRTGRKYR